MEKSRPYVILNAAISIDGKIATNTGNSNLSSKLDKKRVHRLRSNVDAIIVGKNTVQRDNPLLTVRYVKGKNPIRIVIDSKGTISKNSKILKTCKNVPTIIAVSKKTTTKNLSKLNKFPLKIIQSGQEKINIENLLFSLSKLKINTILLEGGGTLNWEFLKKGLIDEVIITITPYLIGGINAISLIQGTGFNKISHSSQLKLVKTKRNKNEIIIQYKKIPKRFKKP